MSDIGSTVWSIEPHTHAKHDILENYLKAWFPILGRYSGRIVYLDGFAGPGIYTGGEEGSPVIAIRTYIDHQLRTQIRAKIVFYFIEKDSARAAKLKDVLKDRFQNLPEDVEYEVEGAEFAPTLERALDQLEKQGARLAPTFAFLDPFGFSGLPMRLISRMLSYDKCEVLITFMLGFIRRFTDELRGSTLDDLFGTDEWKNSNSIADPGEREKFILNLYERQLRTVGGAKYVRSFGMIGSQNQTIYYLVFGTKHLKGIEVMKNAMLSVDRRGVYKFSDFTDPNQTYLCDYTGDAWIQTAGEMVLNRFKGTKVIAKTIKEFVIGETPYCYKAPILERLEQQGKILSVTERSRRFSYPDDCCVTFCT